MFSSTEKTRKQSSTHYPKSTPYKGSTKSTKSTKSSSSYTPHRLSFLFVVNELRPIFDPYAENYSDQWGNILPPSSPLNYGEETVGAVYRYADGLVTPAEGYRWHRPDNGVQGYIAYDVQTEDGNSMRPTHYKTQTAFACSPLLPLLVVGTDPSATSTIFRSACPCGRFDRSTSAEDGEASMLWSLLHFYHPSAPLRGVSQASLGSTGTAFVAGRDASWIQALIPRPFHNSRQDTTMPQAVGLSGELPLVIALMAFWDHKNNGPGEVFGRNNGKWQQRMWNSYSTAHGCE